VVFSISFLDILNFSFKTFLCAEAADPSCLVQLDPFILANKLSLVKGAAGFETAGVSAPLSPA